MRIQAFNSAWRAQYDLYSGRESPPWTVMTGTKEVHALIYGAVEGSFELERGMIHQRSMFRTV